MKNYKSNYASYETIKRELEVIINVLNKKYKQNQELTEEFKSVCYRKDYLKLCYKKRRNEIKSYDTYSPSERADKLRELEDELKNIIQEFKSIRAELKESNDDLKKTKAEHDKILDLFNKKSIERFKSDQMQ